MDDKYDLILMDRKLDILRHISSTVEIKYLQATSSLNKTIPSARKVNQQMSLFGFPIPRRPYTKAESCVTFASSGTVRRRKSRVALFSRFFPLTFFLFKVSVGLLVGARPWLALVWMTGSVVSVGNERIELQPGPSS